MGKIYFCYFNGPWAYLYYYPHIIAYTRNNCWVLISWFSSKYWFNFLNYFLQYLLFLNSFISWFRVSLHWGNIRYWQFAIIDDRNRGNTVRKTFNLVSALKSINTPRIELLQLLETAVYNNCKEIAYIVALNLM